MIIVFYQVKDGIMIDMYSDDIEYTDIVECRKQVLFEIAAQDNLYAACILQNGTKLEIFDNNGNKVNV